MLMPSAVSPDCQTDQCFFFIRKCKTSRKRIQYPPCYSLSCDLMRNLLSVLKRFANIMQHRRYVDQFLIESKSFFQILNVSNSCHIQKMVHLMTTEYPIRLTFTDTLIVCLIHFMIHHRIQTGHPFLSFCYSFHLHLYLFLFIVQASGKISLPVPDLSQIHRVLQLSQSGFPAS